ncbi:hypothetical protein ANN_20684 [Periplaneta americana]|uniref:NACHT domain-containing protein n=1 Tax=Periplaneta americana TaxID=6978 RepID=A0ABQ8SDG1_PERAM|nr:hypothetical protein ANN_20684 [Periplaneta americana]
MDTEPDNNRENYNELEKRLREEMERELNKLKQKQKQEYHELQCKLELELRQILLQRRGTESPGTFMQICATEYERASGVANMTGELYEVKMVALLFVRALNQSLDFHIASSMNAAGAFDDVVLRVGKKTVLIQLKHRENTCKQIEQKDLVKKKGNFSLLKYYESYCKVRNNWTEDKDLQLCGNFQDALFIVYTNAKMAEDIGSNVCNCDWRNILGTGGNCLQFTSETCPQSDPPVDLADYAAFVSQLCFFTEEAAEDKLDDFIRQEIKAACGTDTGYIQLIAKVQEWWRHSSSYLTNETHFWWDIVQSCIADLSQKKITEFENLNVKFRDEYVKQIQTNLPAVGNFSCIVAKGTLGCTALTSLKVYQSLHNDRHIFVDGNVLTTHMSNIQALWGKWCDLLVVVEDGHTPPNFIRSYPGKRLVYILGHKPEEETVAHILHEDEPNLKQLDDESRERVFTTLVNFQGHSVALGEVIGSNEQMVSADVIVRVLTGEFVLGNTLSGDVDYYIPRVIKSGYRVNKDIVSHPITDLPFTLAMSGMEFEALNNEDGGHIKSVHDVEDFLKLTDACDTVHWLHWDGNAFVWMESQGDMNVLLQYLTEQLTYENVVDSVFDIAQRVVLLSDDPGMGKSTLLTHVAKITKKKHPAMWVFRVNLNNFTPKLDELPENLQLSDVIKFLLEVCGVSLHWKDLFKNMENTSILLDGFDEISPTHSDKVALMLRLLQKTKVKKLWITTRPVTASRLQQELCARPFTIRPFSEKDQKDFLAKFWKILVPNLKKSLLDSFITRLLNLAAKYFSNKEKEFMGIPLQSMLLAEAFLEDLKIYNCTGKMKLPRKFAMFQLYKKFVDRKLKIYCERNNMILSRPCVRHSYERMKKELEENHMISSLMVLLSPEDVNRLPNSECMKKKFDKFVEEVEKGIEKTGIITQIVNSVKDYLKDKLFDPNFQIVRIFFDRILAEKFSLHVSVLNQDDISFNEILSETKGEVNKRDDGGRTALHLAVMSHLDTWDGDTSGIIAELLAREADINAKDSVFCWTPLRLAERIRAWAFVNILLENNADTTDMVITRQNLENQNYIQDVLGIAARQGLVSLVEFMLHCGISVGHPISVTRGLFGKPACCATMLHEAAEHGQLKLVQFLVERGADIEARDDEYNRTALMWAAERGELPVIKFLIDKQADINTHDKWSNTALQLASQNGKLDVFKFLIQHASMPNNVMHCAAESGNIDFVIHLLDSGLEIDCRNDYQETPLWRAAWFGQLKVTELLCKRGADVDAKCSVYSQSCGLAYTPLHAAVRGGYLEVVQCLVQNHASLTAKDSWGRTPLDVSQWFKGNDDISEFLKQETTRIQ